MIKQLASALSFFSMINLLALLGLGLYGHFSGRLDRPRLEAIVEILRHGPPPPPVAEAPPPPAAPMLGPQGSAEASAKKILDAVEAEEMDRLQVDRAKAELKQLQVLWDRRMIKLQKDQESFEQRVAEYEKSKDLRREQELSSTYEKTITTIGAMTPKKALDVLMGQDPADAVKVLLSLDDRQRTRILESCKNAEQLEWRGRIMDAMLKQPVGAGAAPLAEGSR